MSIADGWTGNLQRQGINREIAGEFGKCCGALLDGSALSHSWTLTEAGAGYIMSSSPQRAPQTMDLSGVESPPDPPQLQGLLPPLASVLSAQSPLLQDILHIFPQMITNFLSGTRTISFADCGFQVFLSLILLGGECLLLAAMSSDHYVAICHPLCYAMLMNGSVRVLLAMGVWLVGTLNFTVHTAYVLHFPFCYSRAIDHFFCEVPAMLKLSCVDTSHYE
ncbi:Olfactory receptor 2AJ1 [Heterocephalus glaber]|uniref:Olfactory receptor 2AJ1 n=1 Tax=Heterocephalus glaber TaxID=10181 RepID=G5BIY0_HETGA|nr:Olfactory receptor 2AJ1 [Heterocephalus glaber]